MDRSILPIVEIFHTQKPADPYVHSHAVSGSGSTLPIQMFISSILVSNWYSWEDWCLYLSNISLLAAPHSCLSLSPALRIIFGHPSSW